MKMGVACNAFRLSTSDVADALQIARARILGYLKRQRVITVDPDADVLSVSDELAERDPALAQLAATAASGLAPAGPELRRRPVEVAFDGRPGVRRTHAPLGRHHRPPIVSSTRQLTPAK